MACHLVTDVKWHGVVITVWGGRGLSNIIVQIINLIMAPFFNIYNSSGVLECIITNNFVLTHGVGVGGWDGGRGLIGCWIERLLKGIFFNICVNQKYYRP